jgi:UDP-glucose 4-epimerase
VRALVTGGAGFIGSHLVDALLAAGHEPTIVDHLDPARAANFEPAAARGARLVRADVTDVPRMLGAFAQARPEVVFHLAAQIDVRRSVEDPSTDAHVNIGGTAAVLEAARQAGVRRVVLASTAGVYGDPERLPTPETAPLAPLSPYGAGKAAAEAYMSMFSRLHGLSTLSLRMSNVYGPRQNPHGEAGVVAIFCAAAAEGRQITVFGDGAQTRDFVFVEDVVAAFLSAAASDAQGALNVSTGTETSLGQLVETLGVARADGPSRLGEIRRSSLDPALAAERLGWRARTALAEGLDRTLAALALPQ